MAELRPELRPGSDSGASETPPAAGEPVRDLAVAAGDQASAMGGGGDAREHAPHLGPMHSDAGNFASKDFSIWETHLATRLGVSRRIVATLRQAHLQERVDFVKNGSRLLYNEAGAEKLARVLANGDSSEKSLLASVLSEGDPEKTTLKFTVRRKAANTHVLECADAAGAIVIVRVRDSANFLPGMVVEAVPYGDLKNVFEFAGAYPRFRGKY